ncbi:MAG: YdcF family protein [bacterium]
MMLSGVLKKIFKFCLFFCLAIILIFLIEGLYFYQILRKEYSVTKTDAIFVFDGAKERVEAGYKLVGLGYAPNLIISPADSKKLSGYNCKYTLPSSVKSIKEDKSRTTFENALYCSQIIKNNRFKSIALVTSDYHMPRSYFLLKTFLTGSAVKIEPIKVESLRQQSRDKQLKIVYNEMVKLWGSLGEFVYYKLTGHVLERPPKAYKAVQWLRSILLFES